MLATTKDRVKPRKVIHHDQYLTLLTPCQARATANDTRHRATPKASLREERVALRMEPIHQNGEVNAGHRACLGHRCGQPIAHGFCTPNAQARLTGSPSTAHDHTRAPRIMRSAGTGRMKLIAPG